MSQTKKNLLLVACVTAVVFPVVGFLLNMPGLTDRSVTPAGRCIINLRDIDAAEQQWAFMKHKGTNEMPTWEDLTNCTYMKKAPECPAGGKYTLGRECDGPTCSNPEHTRLFRENNNPQAWASKK